MYTRWGYAIERSIHQLKSGKLASLSTLLVLGITLTLPIMLFFANATLHAVAGKSLEGESITVFLKQDISDEQATALSEQWQKLQEVRSADFISSSEALNMLESYNDMDGIVQTLGVNPLPAAVVLYPKPDARNESDMNKFAESLRKHDEVDRVQLDLQWVHRLQAIVALARWIGGLLAVFLTLTAALVIANTIRLELARRHAELEVAQILGAGNAFVNRPIILTGALYGLLGGLLACILALSGLIVLQSAVEDLSNLYSSDLSVYMPTASQIFTALGLSILLGLAGAISTLSRSTHHLTYSPASTR